jgi:hypothetical protein
VQYIPSMMVSFDWRVRHAGLMAIAAIGEGTGKVMQKELQTIVECVPSPSLLLRAVPS